MGATQTMHVFVEVHHLEPIELIRDLLDLLFLARLDRLDAFSIPCKGQRRFFIAQEFQHTMQYSCQEQAYSRRSFWLCRWPSHHCECCADQE